MKKALALIALALPLMVSCGKEKPENNGGDGALAITSLAITSGETVQIPGNVTFQVIIEDEKVNLSTLEVSAALSDGTVIASASIRTPGHKADIPDGSIELPFAAGMVDGESIGLSFKAINVEGAEVRQNRIVTLKRPVLPKTLYMTIGKDVYPMTQNLQNPNLYETASGAFESIATAVIATSEDPGANDFVWVGSDKPCTGRLGTLGEAGIELSFPSWLVDKWAFDTESFEVSPKGEELNISIAGTKLTPSGGILYASVQFQQGATVEIKGISDLQGAWNRDFFSYEGGKLTFLRESGTYDVYYSPKYNYIWIAKMTSVAPENYWVIGHGFTCATEWHNDYFYGGWSETDITRMGYAVKVGADSWQCSMYLNNAHEWATVEFEIYSDLEWGKGQGIELSTISGDTKGLTIGNGKGITSTSGFQSGYYTFTFHASTHTAEIQRISEWQGSSDSGISINGVSLENDASGYAFASINFTKGQSVSVSGISDLEGAYNRDFFSYQNGQLTFLRESGQWSVRYYPAWNYIWVFNESLTYPDCLYVLGNGKMSCPVWYNALGAPTDNFYLRSVPYCCIAPKIADNEFQTTMYLSTDNDWKDVRLEFYSDLAWGKAEPVKIADAAITGNAAAMFEIVNPGLDNCNIHSLDSFEDGYYRVIFRTSASGATVEINKVQ